VIACVVFLPKVEGFWLILWVINIDPALTVILLACSLNVNQFKAFEMEKQQIPKIQKIVTSTTKCLHLRVAIKRCINFQGCV